MHICARFFESWSPVELFWESPNFTIVGPSMLKLGPITVIDKCLSHLKEVDLLSSLYSSCIILKELQCLLSTGLVL